MLDTVLEKYSVTPVTPAKNEVGQPEASPLLGCTPVTPVTPQKNEIQAKQEKADAPATDGDRHHCHECQNLRNGFCTRQRFRPVDDIPRRCEDFSGYSDRLSSTHPTSEAEHNAAGRHFKWLITRPDGTQFYSCSMPRQTLTKVREQFPDAAKIEPIENEDYPHD
jgi:hypothetical protein